MTEETKAQNEYLKDPRAGRGKKNPQDTRLRRVVRLTQSTGQTLLLSLNRDLTYHHQRASGRTGAGYYH